jgi:hypothetical protein
MGNFYVNQTVRTGDREAVLAVLRAAGRRAWVAPAFDGQTVVYDEASDSQDTVSMRNVARLLSRELQVPCLAVLNHDDDVLLYELYESGSLTEDFNSNPTYFGHAAPGGTGRGARLCAAWGAPGAAFAVASLLRRRFPFAVHQHEALVAAVGLSPHGIGTGFTYIEQDELPEGLTAQDLVRVP